MVNRVDGVANPAAGARPLDRDVLRLLRAGPFADALDAVIGARQLSLERIRAQLRARSVTVSRTTLGYWRSGRSRPERSQSLDAVVQLEMILGLPASSLVTLLGPRRPRGRWLEHTAGAIPRHRLWPSSGPILAELDAPSGADTELRSAYELIVVDDARCEQMNRISLVISAVAEQVDRCLVYYQAEDLHQPPPQLVNPRCCRLGRVRTDPACGLLVAELVLDHRLATGECTVVEYELRFPPRRPMNDYVRTFSTPVQSYVLMIQFSETVPARCHRFEQRTPDGPRRTVEQLRIGSSGATSVVLRDVPAGIVGVRWDW
jgi:hypothetical protein